MKQVVFLVVLFALVAIALPVTAMEVNESTDVPLILDPEYHSNSGHSSVELTLRLAGNGSAIELGEHENQRSALMDNVTSVAADLTSSLGRANIVQVQNTAPRGLVVRDSPAGASIGHNEMDGSKGTIISGPTYAMKDGLNFKWWQICWDDGYTGWSAEYYPGGVYYLVLASTGRLGITTDPSEVKVYIGGSYKGLTPFAVDVNPGSYSIKLEKEGYETKYVTTSISAGELKLLQEALPKNTVTSPSVSTSSATSIGSSSATLNGALTSTGGASSCTVYFQYGTSTSYGTTIGTQTKGSTGTFSQSITGLSPGTTYHYRAVASNSAGKVYGADATFTTPSLITTPSVSTSSATSIGSSSATLNGALTSTGGASSCTVYFQYGTSTSYGTTIGTLTKGSTGTFSQSITGLSPGTTYHYRAVASNSAGKVYGADATFMTSNDRVFGIDVSHWQGEINWNSVHNSGKSFAFVKATEGNGFTDPKFITNMNGASANGMLVGAYHFARPDLGNSATDEANYFVDIAGDYISQGYLRPALDLECGGDSLGKEALSEWVKTWISTVHAKTGVYPIIYVNPNYATNYLNQDINQNDLWIAHWKYDPSLSPGTGIWTNWAFWQYSDKGQVSGIEGTVDLDVFNGDQSLLQNYIITSASTPSTRVKLNVPYIHQVYDTADDFIGCWACAPTSAVMVLAYHGLIEKDPIQISSISYGSKPPAHVSDYGKYVSREYQYRNTAFSTESKEYIPNIGWATGKGAWGYIWTGSVTGVADGLESYLKLHDLEVEFIASPTAEQGKTIVIDEIDNNSPLIARTYLTSSGHYAVITGYEIDSNGEISYYVNDPFGKKGYYHKDYGTYTNEIAQPVKYSYSDMGLGEPSRGLFKVTSRLPTPTEPSVSTSPATSVDSSSATLDGYLSSMGGASSCTVYFKYGTTKLYGSTTAPQTKSSTGTFSQALTGLSPGTTYHYRAVASNSAGTVCGADTMFMTSSSATAPVANFIGTPAGGTAPLTVQFTDTSTGDPTAWFWDFGDGSASTEQHPIHTYTAAGMYYVNLTVSNSEGSNTLTQTDPIAVLQYGDVDFDGRVGLADALRILHHVVGLRNITEPLALMQGDLHQNDLLDVGDAQIIAHYRMGLDTLTPRVSGTDSGSVDIVVVPGTRAIPAGEQATINITLVDAENVGSYDITVRWDPAVLDLIPQNNITFPESGVWNVTAGEAHLAGILSREVNGSLTLCTLKFTAIGSPGSSSLVTIPDRECSVLKAYSCNSIPFTISTATVTVNEPAPVANFTANATSGTAPLAVQFTDLSIGDPTTWSWTFGDGATSTERHPIHTYTAPGTYTVSLTVTSAGGSNTMTKMRHVTVTRAVQIGLGDAGAAKGQTTQALLTIRNASAIDAGSLDLTYDPAVVTVDAVHFASPWSGALSINNTNGKARLAYFSSSGYSQSGDVLICTVTLRATGEPGDTSPLNITIDYLDGDGGRDITSAARPLPGEFQVLYPDIPDPVRYRDAGGLYKGIQSGNTLYFGEEGLNLTCLGSVQRLVHYTNFSAGTVDAVIYVPDCRSFDPVAGGNLTPGRYYAWGSDGILGGRPWVEIREPCTGLDVLLGGTNTSVDGTSLTRNAVLDFALENNLGGLHTTPAAIAMDIEVTMPGGGRLVRFGGVDLRGIPVNASTVYARGISLNDTNPGTYTARAVWPSASDFAGKGYNSNTVSFEIAMNTTPPIVGFMANVTSGPSPLTVRFTDTSTGSPTNWFWSFGDGSFSLEQHPIHTYTAPGTYNVSLTVTNAAGSNTTTRAGYITVSRAPGQGILWDVPLSITSGTFNRTMTLGSAESATRGFDAELDLPAPPEPPGTSESAYFTCTDPTFGQLAADYKPPVDDANPEESWVLCIRSDDPVQVAWNTTLLAESVLSLTWDDGTNTIAMKTTNGTTLPAGSYSISISASTARQMDLSLQEGWNLVSTPFNNATYTVPEGAILAIYGYNPSTKGYETVSGVTALVPGKACWIASARNCTVTMTGTPVIPVTAQLKQGWNLIGSTAGRNAFDGIAITPAGSWAMAFVYGYNPQAKVYVPITELQPGEGYWGAVTQNCTITLP